MPRDVATAVTWFRKAAEAGAAPGTLPGLLLHGAGGFDRRLADNSRYASMLAEAGIDAYLVYYYSDLDQRLMFGGLNVFENRYPNWAKMVGDLADYLVTQKDSNGKVGLVGFSNGGILASGASMLDETINAAQLCSIIIH